MRTTPDITQGGADINGEGVHGEAQTEEGGAGGPASLDNVMEAGNRIDAGDGATPTTVVEGHMEALPGATTTSVGDAATPEAAPEPSRARPPACGRAEVVHAQPSPLGPRTKAMHPSAYLELESDDDSEDDMGPGGTKEAPMVLVSEVHVPTGGPGPSAAAVDQAGGPSVEGTQDTPTARVSDAPGTPDAAATPDAATRATAAGPPATPAFPPPLGPARPVPLDPDVAPWATGLRPPEATILRPMVTPSAPPNVMLPPVSHNITIYIQCEGHPPVAVVLLKSWLARKEVALIVQRIRASISKACAAALVEPFALVPAPGPARPAPGRRGRRARRGGSHECVRPPRGPAMAQTAVGDTRTGVARW